MLLVQKRANDVSETFTSMKHLIQAHENVPKKSYDISCLL